MLTSPLPSAFAMRASSLTTWGWVSNLSSAASSMVTTRSPAGIWLLRALSRVVLPPPVPPHTAMFLRERTAQANSCAMGSVMLPICTSSSRENELLRNLRMVRAVPTSETGGITTLTRWPWGRRALTMGCCSSTLRPRGETTLSTTRRSCSSLSKHSRAGCRAPSRSKKTLPGPLTMISVTESSASSGSKGPSPTIMSTSSSHRRWRWAGPSWRKSPAAMSCWMSAPISREACSLSSAASWARRWLEVSW